MFVKLANAGLDKAYDMFQFISKDGKTTTSFAAAMAAKNDTKFCTGFVKGNLAPPKDKQLEIAYKGKQISGAELKAQVQRWVDYGTIEPSAGEAILKCAENPQWLDMSDRYFVLLGAGSAMGPFEVLMSLGANVIAIDLDRPQIWQRLIERARNSSGSLTFPLRQAQGEYATDADLYAGAGCNLFTETPLIRDWLVDLYPGKPFTVGSYAYLNGALHVQVSLAMDAICRDLCEKRPGGASLAYLCTPTDLHLIPKEAREAAQTTYREFSKKPFCMLMKLLGGKKLLRKNVRDPVSGVGGDFYYVNGISVAQGPNYGRRYCRRASLTDALFFSNTCALSGHPKQPWRSVCNTGARSSLAAREVSSPPTSLPPHPRSLSCKTELLLGPTRGCHTSHPTRSLLLKRPNRS